MATYSSILAWEIPWTEEPGRLQSMGSQSQKGLSDYNNNNKINYTAVKRMKMIWMCVPDKDSYASYMLNSCKQPLSVKWEVTCKWKRNTRKGAQHFKNHNEIPLSPMQMAKSQSTDNIKWCSGSGGSETLQYSWVIVNYCKHFRVLSVSVKVDH